MNSICSSQNNRRMDELYNTYDIVLEPSFRAIHQESSWVNEDTS